MTLNFTKAELLQLLTLASIGDWVKHAQFEGNPKDNEAANQDQKVMQKLMAATFKAKFPGLVEYDIKSKEYFETTQLEDMFMPHVDEFNENEFWDQLSHRMAQRDMFLKYGDEALQSMENTERVVETMEIADSYSQIFDQDGLINLKIDR